MDGYERLASAVVAQAEKDYITYKVALFKYKKKLDEIKNNYLLNTFIKNKKIKEINIRCDKLNNEINDIIDFFHSSWFTVLSDSDGDLLLKKLEAKYEGIIRKAVQNKKEN